MKTCLVFNTLKLLKEVGLEKEHFIKQKEKHLLINKLSKGRKGRPFSVIFPKIIKILPETFGLIVGEGYFGDRHFVFANSNEKAIDLVTDFLNQFGIPIKRYLEISTKNMADSYKEECTSFWENYLQTKIKRVRLRKEFNSITKHGTIHLIVSNSLLAKLLKPIVRLSKTNIERNKELSASYLKGIIAAEGNVNIKKGTNCVYMIRISAMKEEEREHYKRCLEKTGIKIYCEDMPSVSKEEGKQRGWKTDKGRAGAVIISRWENFVKVINFGLLDLNADKNNKFQEYFKNNKFTVQFVSFSHFLNKEFTMKEAQNYFGFSGRHVNRVLTLYKQRYISRRLKNGIFYYRLSKKYSNLHAKLIGLGIAPSL